jgi:peptidyl-prolyl cis-trans isomerase C
MSFGGPMSDVPSSSSPRWIRRWLREPLLHFLIVGLALFAVYRAMHPGPDRRETANRIEVTDADLRQLAIAWTAQWQRAPTPEELRGLVASKVHEEILYREALALGLEKGDAIVIRRLAQKMEFLAEDVSTVREPEADELKAWFAKNQQRFLSTARASFRHLYFSFDKRHERARDDAVRSLEVLAGKPAEVPEAEKLADPFMFQENYGDRLPEQVAGVFGTKFAKALFKLKPGEWSGPIESGFGWHLIWVDSMTPGRLPAFEEIEPMVKSEWITEQRVEAKLKIFEAMKARYDIVLPGSPTK